MSSHLNHFTRNKYNKSKVKSENKDVLVRDQTKLSKQSNQILRD